MTSVSLITKWRYRLIPDHLIGEILGKPWIDNVIPVMALAVVLLLFGVATPEFFRVASLSDLGRELGEYLFIAIGLAIVMIAGG
ncbi:MAG TPA: hypothetical protein VG897_03535, partial [Terriglobales bacterium]|nr:hypothetical protein [Terriglobales bacterium]